MRSRPAVNRPGPAVPPPHELGQPLIGLAPADHPHRPAFSSERAGLTAFTRTPCLVAPDRRSTPPTWVVSSRRRRLDAEEVVECAWKKADRLRHGFHPKGVAMRPSLTLLASLIALCLLT